MIDHIRKNIGKEFMYVLPVLDWSPSKKIVDYIICVVEIKSVRNKTCEVLIKEVIKETDRKYYTYLCEHKSEYWASNKYLFEL